MTCIVIVTIKMNLVVAYLSLVSTACPVQLAFSLSEQSVWRLFVRWMYLVKSTRAQSFRKLLELAILSLFILALNQLEESLPREIMPISEWVFFFSTTVPRWSLSCTAKHLLLSDPVFWIWNRTKWNIVPLALPQLKCNELCSFCRYYFITE